MNDVVLFEPYADWIHAWACNENSTPMMQVILAFSFGVILSPWSYGLFFLFVGIIFYEIFLYVFTHGNERYYDVFTRCGVIYASILGYIIGRTITNMDVLNEGVPDFPSNNQS